jgi:hypothetical protein
MRFTEAEADEVSATSIEAVAKHTHNRNPMRPSSQSPS